MAKIRELRLGKDVNEKLENSGYRSVGQLINANIKKFKAKTGLSDRKIVQVIGNAKKFQVKKQFSDRKKIYYLRRLANSYSLVHYSIFAIGLALSVTGIYLQNYNNLVGGSMLMFLSGVLEYF